MASSQSKIWRCNLVAPSEPLKVLCPQLSLFSGRLQPRHGSQRECWRERLGATYASRTAKSVSPRSSNDYRLTVDHDRAITRGPNSRVITSARRARRARSWDSSRRKGRQARRTCRHVTAEPPLRRVRAIIVSFVISLLSAGEPATRRAHAATTVGRVRSLHRRE